MPLPQHTEALLYASGSWRLPGADDAECEGSKYHTPTPMFTNAVRLVPEEWDSSISAFSPVVMLCGTCRDNLAMLQQIYAARDGDVPWPVRREFGNLIQALAKTGWARYADARARA